MNALERANKIIQGLPAMYEEMAAAMPRVVHCPRCGREAEADPAVCLREGWEQCCGLTMHLGKLPPDFNKKQ